MKEKILRAFASIMSTVIAMLGFSACDDIGGMVEEYGCPSAEYEIKGKVTNEANQPVDSRVIINDRDTVYTKEDGHYATKKKDFPFEHFKVKCEALDGKYEPDSTQVSIKFQGGYGHWYEGSGSVDVYFVLKPKSAEAPEQ